MSRAGVFLIGLVAFAAAGAAAYFAAGGNSGGPGPVECGSSDTLEVHCIAGVPGDTVLAILRERGFECSQDRFCELEAASTSYQAEIVSHGDVDDLIVSYTLDVRHDDPDPGLSPRATSFLTWFMAMPFGNDPEAGAASREWLTEHLGSDQEATIRGFDFTLAAPEPGHVRLSFDGIGDPGPPRTVDGEEVEIPEVEIPGD
jgi:hypothetical protein